MRRPFTKPAPQQQSADAPSYVRANTGSKLAHRAFWIMARRVTVVAACVDLAFLILFLVFESPFLAWLNLLSIAMYGCAYWLLSRRINNAAALALIWLEVLGHSAIGSMLVGWDSGFHYYLLMFIPALVINGSKRISGLLLLLLLAFYLGLHTVSRNFGVLAPLSSTGLSVVHGFNVVIVFWMASYTARFYYDMVRKAERELLELATTDSLSGLFNRHHLLACAEREMVRAKRTRDPISLIIADIDHFKQINDHYGHDAGDRVIVHTSELLLKLCRAHDIVARWGGEEFLLLLPATSIDAASALAERLRQTVAATSVEYGGAHIRFTLSFGVTTLAVGEDLNTSIARVDRALYQSKEKGRNCVTLTP